MPSTAGRDFSHCADSHARRCPPSCKKDTVHFAILAKSTAWRKRMGEANTHSATPAHDASYSLPVQDTASRGIATSIESAVSDDALVRSALSWLVLGRVGLIVRVDRDLFGRRQSFAVQCRWFHRRRIRIAHRRRRKRVQWRSAIVIHRDGDISDHDQPKRYGQGLQPARKVALTDVPRCLVHCHDHLLLTSCNGPRSSRRQFLTRTAPTKATRDQRYQSAST